MTRDLLRALVPNNRELKEHLQTIHKLMSRRLASEMPNDLDDPQWFTLAVWTDSLKAETKRWLEQEPCTEWLNKRQLIMLFLQEALALQLELTSEEAGTIHTEEPVSSEGVAHG